MKKRFMLEAALKGAKFKRVFFADSELAAKERFCTMLKSMFPLGTWYHADANALTPNHITVRPNKGE
jgi:hypothetical protein